MKRQETTHAVTLEIAETKIGTASTFQPRIRLDAMVFVDIGRPRRSPLDALEVLAEAFASARRIANSRARGLAAAQDGTASAGRHRRSRRTKPRSPPPPFSDAIGRAGVRGAPPPAGRLIASLAAALDHRRRGPLAAILR